MSAISQQVVGVHITDEEFVKGRIDWSSLIGIIVFHILALAAPFTFSWPGFIAFVVLTALSLLGVTVGFHRLLTHRSFKAVGWVKYLFTFLGCLALQGGPIYWVTTHRLHHKETDKAGDPHSPQHGFWWSHMLWTFYKHPKLDTPEDLEHYAPDLFKDPVIRFLDKYDFVIFSLLAVAFFVTGTFLQDWQLGLSLVVWGFIFRTVYSWHVTWLVNSATHLWGYRHYKTTDDSTNNWWVALLTFGEGWHNNHHAHPRSAKLGATWYEVDVAYWFIAGMRALGLVKDVIQLPPKNKVDNQL